MARDDAMTPAPRPEVVHFTDSADVGGAEHVLLMLLQGLDRRRWQPLLLHPGGPGLAPLLRDAAGAGVPLVRVPEMPEGLQSLLSALRLTAWLRRRRPAVFHAHMTWPLGAKWALVAAVLARVPVVVATMHLWVDIPVTASRRAQATLLGRRVATLIAVSEDAGRRMRADLGWGGPVTVVRNAVALERFPAPGPAPCRNAAEPAVAVVAARLVTQKGHGHLLEAARRLPRVRFLCAGDGPLRSDLERRAREMGVADRVTFLGHRTDIPALLHGADLAVLPSLYEGLPLSLVEAMAAARPVVATDVGGSREVVIHGVTGLLVPPGDPEALAGAIGRVASDPALAARFGAEGRRRVEADFTAEAMVARVEALYARLLGA